MEQEKSICRIKINKIECGTGFFCLVPFLNKLNFMQALITNNHVINQNYLSKNKKIKLTINNININMKF